MVSHAMYPYLLLFRFSEISASLRPAVSVWTFFIFISFAFLKEFRLKFIDFVMFFCLFVCLLFVCLSVCLFVLFWLEGKRRARY